MRAMQPALASLAVIGLAMPQAATSAPKETAGMIRNSGHDTHGTLIGDRLGAESTLRVKSSAFADGAPIPDANAAAGKDVSPPLEWLAGPPATKSYAVLVEDPDAPGPRPFVHWLAWNIPAGTTSLPGAVMANAPGLVQGRNGRGEAGYFGPKPPPGAPHRYFTEVFALDRILGLPAGADRDALEAAMKGHILAAGRLMGTFQTGEEN